jgi:hypothetical protein
MWPRIGFAILTFLIYGSGVLSLHQERHSGWSVEVSSSLPAALSYSVYGTPLGMINVNVESVFREVFLTNRISVQEAVARSAAGDLPSGGVTKISNDGNGAGYPIFASLAMRLFGSHLSSVLYSFLLLMGVSTLAFIYRFQDDRLFMVPLLFFALALMLLLASNARVRDQCPIGGIRYFSVAGILPTLHILFELSDRLRPQPTAAIRNLILLALQVLMFAVVVLARGSAGYLLGLVVLAALVGICANWRSRAELRQMIGKAGFTILVSMGFVSIIAASVPDYVKTGRFFGTVWHRAVVSLGRHPDWPFGNLREVYDCTNVIPQGLVRGSEDRNAHCIFWSSYPRTVTGKPSDKEVEEVNAHTHDGIYESLMRSAFFYVVRDYPRQVFELHFYYKSVLILRTLRKALHLDLTAQDTTILALIALQCGVFIAFVVWGAYCVNRQITPRVGIMLVLFVFSLTPLYVAWSDDLSTSIDTIAFMYASAAILLGGLAQITTEETFGIRKSDMRSA